ncbi:MAG: alkaline phosphatase [Chloroflexi bacterium]|nr:alkaline phosphatase [Chloroflexota bacterium]
MAIPVLLLASMPVSPVGAQSPGDGPAPVLILPTDRAAFLPGATFDIRIEIEGEALPADLAITVDGAPAADFFGAESTTETWSKGPETAPVPVQGVTWRGVSFAAPGSHTVEVTADGATTSVDWNVLAPSQGAGARNVILFIADGWTVAELTAARVISRGNVEGKYLRPFTIDQMPAVGLAHTSGLDSIITDSANAASALNTGHKAAVNALGSYPDTSPASADDPKVETFAELVKRLRGMSVGIVTTADWTDATPAAVFAHTRRRGDQADIAAAPLDSGLLPEVILGGGANWMLPETVEGGRRADGRDLFDEYEAAGYSIVTDATELATAGAAPPERLLGLFHSGNMNVWLDRNVFTDNQGSFTDQPGLVAMTNTALEILGTNENGFYLMVEAASVDKQIHPLDVDRMVGDIIEFDDAIDAAVRWAAANAPDTLIVITADHGHGFETFGTVDVEAFNAAADIPGKLDAIGLYADAGFPTYVDADGDGFPDDWAPSRVLAALVNNHPEYTEDFQVSSVPRVPAIAGADGSYIDNPDDDPNGIPMTPTMPLSSSQGVHTLQDVPVFAGGPGAEYFGAVLDNTDIFFGMAAAIGLDPSAADGITPADAVAPEVACEGVDFGGVCFTR